ncbi:ThiF family adenylyltransferase [Citricoccus sp. GCM10030269]|uniref:ThiF family adenylyltransferase n=1 Tax=Citricoccus sp. GCM10030269 TaxID=3273388 RepID=UPI00361F72D5
MRLDPGLSLLHVTSDTVQIGSGARSTQLSGCSPAALDYLRELASGILDGREAETARKCALDPAAARELEGALEEFLRHHDPPVEHGAGHTADLLAEDLGLALALDPLVPVPLPAAEETAETSTAAEPDPTVVFAQATDTEERTAELLARRRATQVQVLGLGRTGAVLAGVLASTGIGRLVLWDRCTVAAADLGTGYRAADLGRSRPVALSRRLEDAGQGTVVLPLTSPERPGPAGTVSVSVTRGAVDYDFVALARAADHPVLPVVLRDDDALIGPWFIPGAGGCPLCWDLAAQDSDPYRQLRNTALLDQRAGNEDLALATVAGALAARQATRWAETGTAPTGVVLRLHGDGSRVDTLGVPDHPDCGCADAG